MEISLKRLLELEACFYQAKEELDEIEKVGFNPNDKIKLLKHYISVGCATDECLMRVFDVSESVFYSIKDSFNDS